MELASPIINQRTDLCVVALGSGKNHPLWPDAFEDFLKKLSKLSMQITLIGAKTPPKSGSKKNVKVMERYDVIGFKRLEASKSHRLEFRVFNLKSKAWVRLRANACIVLGDSGLWPDFFEGWSSNGTLTLEALARFVFEFKFVPGRDFAFLGSSNKVLKMATALLDRGATSCYVIESGSGLKCWQSLHDRFIAKGGRVLLDHHVIRAGIGANGIKELFVKNQVGTLVLPVDTVVFGTRNEEAFNSPIEWKQGLYYIQRRRNFWEKIIQDEEGALEKCDWEELFYRIARQFEKMDRAQAEGWLKKIKMERKSLLQYRKLETRDELQYSGKILDRDTLLRVRKSVSTPKKFERVKPVASLECFENIPCRACEEACPESAIEIKNIIDQPKLIEDKCTGCGACVAACPAGVAVMLKEEKQGSKARFFLPDDTREFWRPGQNVQLLNRKGDVMGMGRMQSSVTYENGLHRMIEVETTQNQMWEIRNFRKVALVSDEKDLPSDTQVFEGMKSGWVQINGARRFSPIGVPITVALWRLGIRRFQDGFFCPDGGCRMCEVSVNGETVLACQKQMQEGQSLVLPEFSLPKTATLLCPCKQVSRQDFDNLRKEGVSQELSCELTGVGKGMCHGRWCLSSAALSEEESRLKFWGFEGSPWRDFWAKEILEDEDGRSH